MQPLLKGISPIYIYVWSVSCSTHRLISTAHMVLPERRYKTEDMGGGALGERMKKGDAGNMQRGSEDESRNREGKRGADGRAVSRGE